MSKLILMVKASKALPIRISIKMRGTSYHPCHALD